VRECTIAADGDTTITYSAEDVAGNEEAEKTGPPTTNS
jgi:hypothetical protein